MISSPSVKMSDNPIINELRDKGYIIRTDLNDSADVDFVNENGKWKLKE